MEQELGGGGGGGGGHHIRKRDLYYYGCQNRGKGYLNNYDQSSSCMIIRGKGM